MPPLGQRFASGNDVLQGPELVAEAVTLIVPL